MYLKDKYKIIFLLILISAALLRVLWLNKYPPALSWDEISHGYTAYSILKTGHDEWGQLLPLSNFKAYGDYPLVANMYFMIPTIALMGLNEVSVRLPGAIFGILTVIASYYLAYGVTKSKKISLLTALLSAFEPWNWFLNRFAAQSNLSVFFLTASAAAFFNREKSKYLTPLSILFLGLTLYSYHTTRIVSPLILLACIFVCRGKIWDVLGHDLRIKILSIFILLFFFVPLPFILANPASRARSNEVFLLNEGAINKIIEKRLSSSYSPLVSRLLYNRPLFFITEAIKNHIEYYTPRFLFFAGGTHYQFSLPGYGLLFPVNLPFFYLGIYLVLKKAISKNKEYQFILLWFLLAPLSGSITKEHYAVMRATPMIPLVQLFSAIGVIWVLDKIKKIKRSNLPYLFIGVYLLVAFINFFVYSKEYFGNYTLNYSQDRQYGYKEALKYAKANYNNYDRIIITKKYGEPHEFVLFYWPWDPATYRNDPSLVRFHQSNWYWVDRFDKFYFVNDWQIPKEKAENWKLEIGTEFECFTSRCLLITGPDNYPRGWNKLQTINFLNGLPAFDIYEN